MSSHKVPIIKLKAGDEPGWRPCPLAQNAPSGFYINIELTDRASREGLSSRRSQDH